MNQYGCEWKRWICTFLVVLLALGVFPILQVHAAEVNSEENSEDETSIYKDYFLTTGYAGVLYDYYIPAGDMTVDSWLIDIDGDSVEEAVVQISSKYNEVFSLAMDINEKTGVPYRSLYVCHTGGSMGGEYIWLKYDTQDEKFVIVHESNYRAMSSASAGERVVYSDCGKTKSQVLFVENINMAAADYEEYFKATVEKVMFETDLYIVEDQIFCYYMMDDEYISRDEYRTMLARYEEPSENGEYRQYQGTYENPFGTLVYDGTTSLTEMMKPGRNVPDWYDENDDQYSFVNQRAEIPEAYFTSLYGPNKGKEMYAGKKDVSQGGICVGYVYTTAAILSGMPDVTEFANKGFLGITTKRCETMRDLNMKSETTWITGDALTLRDFIYYSFISQWSRSKLESSNKTQSYKYGLKPLIDAVNKKLENNQIGVCLSIVYFRDVTDLSKQDRHEVLVIGTEDNALLIDDPNSSEGLHKITINDNGSWYYDNPWDSSFTINQDYAILSFSTDFATAYEALLTGQYVQTVEDSNIVGGMNPVDKDTCLVVMNAGAYMTNNELLPLFDSATTGDYSAEEYSGETTLFWLLDSNTLRLENLENDENTVKMAGEDAIVSVDVTAGANVTISMEEESFYAEVEAEKGQPCSISVENCYLWDEDVMLTVKGTVGPDGVRLARTEDGVSVSGMTDVSVQILIDEEVVSQTNLENDASEEIEIAYDKTGSDTSFEIDGQKFNYVDFRSTNLALGGNIGLNFIVELSENLVQDESAFIRFTYQDYVVEIPLSEGEESVKNGVTRYTYSCPITSRHMTDAITAQIYNAKGPVGDSASDSVRNYCDRLFKINKDPKLADLMHAMLNYGAAAQVQFNYKPDDLANSLLTEEQKELHYVDLSEFAIQKIGKDEGIKAATATMFLDSETTIRIYYRLLGDKPIDAYTITIDGKAVEPTPEGDRYYVEIQDIAAHRLDDMHTITAGNETLIYGPMSFAYTVLTKEPEGSSFYNLALALYAYSAAAENYIQ